MFFLCGRWTSTCETLLENTKAFWPLLSRVGQNLSKPSGANQGLHQNKKTSQTAAIMAADQDDQREKDHTSPRLSISCSGEKDIIESSVSDQNEDKKSSYISSRFHGFSFEAQPLKEGGTPSDACCDFLKCVQDIFADKIASNDAGHGSMAPAFVVGDQLVTVATQTLHEDSLFGVSLVERHVPVVGLTPPVDEVVDSSLLSLASMSSVTSVDIRSGLAQFGETSIGPITEETRRAYLIHLKKLRLGLRKPKEHSR